MTCDSQDLILHTVLSDGVATVRQTLAVTDFECYGLFTTATRHRVLSEVSYIIWRGDDHVERDN